MNMNLRVAVAATAMTVAAVASLVMAPASSADSTTCLSSGGRLGDLSAALDNHCFDTPLDPWVPIWELLENVALPATPILP